MRHHAAYGENALLKLNEQFYKLILRTHKFISIESNKFVRKKTLPLVEIFHHFSLNCTLLCKRNSSIRTVFHLKRKTLRLHSNAKIREFKLEELLQKMLNRQTGKKRERQKQS